MKQPQRLLATAAAMFFSLGAQAEEASPPCLDLSCMLCPAASNAEHYASGGISMARFLALGENQWLFRSTVDFESEFGTPADMEPELRRLIAAFRAQGTDVMFTLQPTRGMMHRDKILPGQSHGFDFPKARANLANFQDQLRRAGALAPDILQLVDNPPEQEYFFRRDTHWTPSGAAATARIIADAIRTLPYYTTLEKKQFRTEPGVTIVNYGVLDQALSRLCHNEFGNQYLRGYRTVPVVDDAAALFDDQAEPQVVLTGTSNSAARDEETRHYNFDGYLKEYTELDILNYAMQGAGQYGALIEYLHSDDYDPKNAPRLLVWELPISYRLDASSMYRQLIPAVKGGCKAAQSLHKQQSQLPALKVGDRLEVLNNAGADRLELTGTDGFIELKLSDRNLRDFYLITYYDNGERDKIRIRRPGVVTGGLYRLELSRAPSLQGANLLSVLLEPNQATDTPSTVDAQLCR